MDNKVIALIEDCGAHIQNKLSPKLKDTSSFSMPCIIVSVEFSKVLRDLSASVLLIPLSVAKQLELNELK